MTLTTRALTLIGFLTVTLLALLAVGGLLLWNGARRSEWRTNPWPGQAAGA